MQINIYHKHKNDLSISYTKKDIHPPADLPRFFLYYSLFRSNPNINPTTFDNPNTNARIYSN